MYSFCLIMQCLASLHMTPTRNVVRCGQFERGGAPQHIVNALLCCYATLLNVPNTFLTARVTLHRRASCSAGTKPSKSNWPSSPPASSIILSHTLAHLQETDCYRAQPLARNGSDISPFPKAIDGKQRGENASAELTDA